jgi:hypothetical protein
MSKSPEERRKQNAARQAKLRASRDAAGLCRTCGAPAAISARTGRLAKQCGIHLGVDKARKTPEELIWEQDQEQIDESDDLSGCYRLPWIGRPSPSIPLVWHDHPVITG